MDFVEIQFTCNADLKEILIAELGELGFDSMMETESGFNAYIPKDLFQEELIIELEDKYAAESNFGWRSDVIKHKNWNEEWEKNFEPVLIDESCIIRSTFHQHRPDIHIEIVINPKMSFGTGHHATTFLMIRQQLKIDHSNKRILDCGCGTGILSILARKLGAKIVTGFDIDDWAIENARENVHLNQVSGIQLKKGTMSELDIKDPFDIILANINKNVLRDDIPEYSKLLNPGGTLLISGFYDPDLPDLNDIAMKNRLDPVFSTSKEEWSCAQYIKR